MDEAFVIRGNKDYDHLDDEYFYNLQKKSEIFDEINNISEEDFIKHMEEEHGKIK